MASGSSTNNSGQDAKQIQSGVPRPPAMPPFVSKLYSMVNDPATDELIRWSPSGESFIVPNHVRFGEELVPRFFKHRNFSSFVRQLNMYGFHKVPHLHQGVLKHDSDSTMELWEFNNPNFKRGRPELLSLVQRKRPMPNEHDHSDELIASAGGSGSSGSAGTLDLSTALTAIQTIKRNQNTILADLKHLQNSNQHLWKEAIESRQRSKRQQDTINRILRFLAGVFGTEAGAAGAASGRRVAVVPKKKNRLLIGDGKVGGVFGADAGGVGNSDDFEEIELPFDDQDDGADASSSKAPTGLPDDSTRFSQLGYSPPPQQNEFDGQTSSGMKRGSSTQGQQFANMLQALAQAEGGQQFFASLFSNQGGGNGGGSPSPSNPTGFKLDPAAMNALSQVIQAASPNGTFNFDSVDDSDRFTYPYSTSTANNSGGSGDNGPMPMGTPQASLSAWLHGLPSGGSTGSERSAAHEALRQASPQFMDPAVRSQLQALSQVLVPSAPMLSWPSSSAVSPSSTSRAPQGVDAKSPLNRNEATLTPGHLQRQLQAQVQSEGNEDMALSPFSTLYNNTKGLEKTTSDVNNVSKSINALVETLNINPRAESVATDAALALDRQHDAATAATSVGLSAPGARTTVADAGGVGGAGVEGVPNVVSSAAGAAPATGLAGIPSSSSFVGGGTGSTGFSGADGAVAPEFDLDSFLNQFVETPHSSPENLFSMPSPSDSSFPFSFETASGISSTSLAGPSSLSALASTSSGPDPLVTATPILEPTSVTSPNSSLNQYRGSGGPAAANSPAESLSRSEATSGLASPAGTTSVTAKGKTRAPPVPVSAESENPGVTTPSGATRAGQRKRKSDMQESDLLTGAEAVKGLGAMTRTGTADGVNGADPPWVTAGTEEAGVNVMTDATTTSLTIAGGGVRPNKKVREGSTGGTR